MRLLTDGAAGLFANRDDRVEHGAIGFGSAGELPDLVRELGCDCLVNGETRYDTWLNAEAEVRARRRERDPLPYC